MQQRDEVMKWMSFMSAMSGLFLQCSEALNATHIFNIEGISLSSVHVNKEVLFGLFIAIAFFSGQYMPLLPL